MIGMTRDCLDPWTYVEFSGDGGVKPCCVRAPVGNIQTESIAKILNGQPIRLLRLDLLGGTLDRVCRGCRQRGEIPVGELRAKVRAVLREVQVPALLNMKDYAASNPDAELSDPVRHFLEIGRFEGFNAAPDVDLSSLSFREAPYVRANPDVAAGEFNPYRHFIEHGQFEARRLRNFGDDDEMGEGQIIHFEPDAYLAANRDVAQSGVHPASYYLERGQYEERPLRLRIGL